MCGRLRLFFHKGSYFFFFFSVIQTHPIFPIRLPSSLIFEEMQTRYGIKVLMESKSKKKEIYCPLYIISPHVSAIYDHTLGRGLFLFPHQYFLF